MRVADVVAEVLKREGCGQLFGYPLNPFIEAAAAAGVRTIIPRNERTGIHMADGWSRQQCGSRVPAFAIQHGPGAENAFGAVAQAYSESVPMVLLPAGYPRELTDVYPNFNASHAYRSVTKWCEQVTVARAVPDALRRAFTQARNGRPGPALVEVPVDVAAEDAPEPVRYEPARRVRTAPDPQDVEAAARVLREAERPVIYAGQGVHWAQAWDELRALAELLDAPVATSLQGKSAFPEDHPLSLGAGGLSTPPPLKQHLADADVVFGIGCSFSRTSYGVRIPADGKTVVHATLDATDLGKDLPAQHALLGDAKLTLAMLLDALGGRRGQRDAAARIASQRESFLQQWLPKLTSDEVPISPYRLVWDLLHTVDVANTIVTHDAGSPRDQLSPFWCATRPLTYLGWGKTTQLGYGLGLVMGAKLARPDMLCVNFWGDAAVGFTGMDFETCVRERIPILSVVSNNFSMAIEVPMMPQSTERYRATDISGDYADLARALGGYGERVTEPSEIVPALQRGIKQTLDGTPALIEVITSKESARV